MRRVSDTRNYHIAQRNGEHTVRGIAHGVKDPNPQRAGMEASRGSEKELG